MDTHRVLNRDWSVYLATLDEKPLFTDAQLRAFAKALGRVSLARSTVQRSGQRLSKAHLISVESRSDNVNEAPGFGAWATRMLGK